MVRKGSPVRVRQRALGNPPLAAGFCLGARRGRWRVGARGPLLGHIDRRGQPASRRYAARATRRRAASDSASSGRGDLRGGRRLPPVAARDARRCGAGRAACRARRLERRLRVRDRGLRPRSEGPVGQGAVRRDRRGTADGPRLPAAAHVGRGDWLRVEYHASARLLHVEPAPARPGLDDEPAVFVVELLVVLPQVVMRHVAWVSRGRSPEWTSPAKAGAGWRRGCSSPP
jgi:hypothetical protein